MRPWPPEYSASADHASVTTLSMNHLSDLEEAAADGDLNDLWYTTIPKPSDVGAEIERRLDLRAKGSMLPFAILDNVTGRAIGMTTYMNIDAPQRRLEIGSTWYRKSAQRGPLNTECKWLLLRNAFENLDCIAVEFRTHFINSQSRRAIERLGARQDGILRNHMIMENGTLRDTVVYSIIAGEWPMIDAHLKHQMSKPR